MDAPTDAERLVSGAAIKLLLNLALLGVDSLPMGGSLSVRSRIFPMGQA